jgi:acetate---CoA ligase (ADP-forming) subunit beta
MAELLLGVDALLFLEKEGFPVLKSALAKDENQAARMAAEVGFPATLKVSSPDVIHKTETGGIRVSLKDEAEVRAAFREITALFASRYPGKRLDGAIVQGQGRGLELIVGVTTDPQFGPVLMFGLGGVFVEALNDVSFRYIPLEPRDAREMIEDLRGYKALGSPRGEPIDLALIEEFLLNISRFVERHEEIQEMDLNPVFISSEGIAVCDARIRTLTARG